MECLRGLSRFPHQDHQGMRHRPHRVFADKLAAHHHGNTVATAYVGASLDHGDYGRVHPPGPETNDPPLPGRLLAPGSLCRNTGGLTEETKDCGLKENEGWLH